jgi:hypothetical protein
VAAKPLDIWQTPSSTHWQYPPKRIVHRPTFYGHLLAKRTAWSLIFGELCQIGRTKKDGSEINVRSQNLVPIATQREAQSSTHLIHSCGTKLGHTFPQALLRHRNCMVQVHRARGLHAVLLIQNDFRWHAANGGSDRRNRDCG